MKITQKKIIRVFFVLLCTFLVFLVLRIIMLFLPPLITKVTMQASDESSNIITVRGFGLGPIDYSAAVYFDQSLVEKTNILSWSSNKINFKVAPSDKEAHVIQVVVREQKSNKKILLYFDITTNEKKNSNINITKPEEIFYVETDNPIGLFEPLLFVMDDQQNVSNYSYNIFGIQKTIPKYWVQENLNLQGLGQQDFEKSGSNVIRIFLPESIWAYSPDSLSITIESLLQKTHFSVALKSFGNDSLASDNPNNQIMSEVTLFYTSLHTGNFFLIPLSTHYQSVAIPNTRIIWNEFDSYVTIPRRTQKIVLNVYSQKSRAYNGDNDSVVENNINNPSVTPYIYTDLFLPENTVNNLSDDVSNRKTISENHPMLKLLYNPLSKKDNVKLEDIIKNYKTLLVKFASNPESSTYLQNIHDMLKEQSATQISQFDIYQILDHIALEESMELSTEDLTRAVLFSYLLREKGLIARTILGYTINYKPEVSSPQVWIEILTKENAWMSFSLNAQNIKLDATRPLRISLVMLEEYLNMYRRNQFPTVPMIESIINK